MGIPRYQRNCRVQTEERGSSVVVLTVRNIEMVWVLGAQVRIAQGEQKSRGYV